MSFNLIAEQSYRILQSKQEIEGLEILQKTAILECFAFFIMNLFFPVQEDVIFEQRNRFRIRIPLKVQKTIIRFQRPNIHNVRMSCFLLHITCKRRMTYQSTECIRGKILYPRNELFSLPIGSRLLIAFCQLINKYSIPNSLCDYILVNSIHDGNMKHEHSRSKYKQEFAKATELDKLTDH